MEAEEKLKKIKIFVFIFLAIASIETIFGFTAMYTGIMYKKFDTQNAMEMFEIIKESNVEYYEKLTDSGDRSYMQEFEKFYTKRGNISLIILGIFIILFSVLGVIPVILIMFTVQGEKEEAVAEDSGEKVEEET